MITTSARGTTGMQATTQSARATIAATTRARRTARWEMSRSAHTRLTKIKKRLKNQGIEPRLQAFTLCLRCHVVIRSLRPNQLDEFFISERVVSSELAGNI